MPPTESIPKPKGDPFIGNLRSVDGDAPIQGFMRLARIHGPIYQLDFIGSPVIVVGSQELVNELCDEARFDKRVAGALKNIRDFAGDGLFTARTDEPNWAKAHRLLMPAFGPMGIRGMFDRMYDIAEQMLLRWERFGADNVIEVTEDMTRMTLDTIALCAFDYRFNSFYQREMHPFIGAMVDALAEAGARTRRPELASKMLLRTRRAYEDDVELMREVADSLIAERKRDPNAAQKKDLLGLMLQGRDPVTGEGLSDENIRYQLIMINEAEKNGVQLMTAYRLHFEAANLEAIKRAHSKRIGELRIFNSVFTFQVKDQNNIRLDTVDKGGGPLYDIGIYCINASRYLFKSEPIEVFATATSTKDSRFRKNDETISCILKYPDGKIANFTVSFGTFASSDYDLIGTKGRIRLEKAYEYAGTMILKTYEEGKTFIKRYPKRDQFAPELIYFSDCIQRKKKVEPSGEEGLMDIKIIEALLLSIDLGSPITLEEIHKRTRPGEGQKITRPSFLQPKLFNARGPEGTRH